MGELLNKKTVIDTETGEVVKQINWMGYDGFNDKGYKYREKQTHIRYYFDAIPPGLSKDALVMLILLAEQCTEENLMLKRVKRKSKFSNITFKPLDKEEIFELMRYPMGINKFNSCWEELKKHCIKEIRYEDMNVWAINPAIISKCKQVPIWLYDEFKDYMNPYLTATTISKFNYKLRERFF